jgi:hypothetical protein
MIVKSALVPNAFSFPVLPVKSELTLAYSAVKEGKDHLRRGAGCIQIFGQMALL